MMTTTANGKTQDANGFAPGNVQVCDVENCRTCGGMGWILCDHQGADIEIDPINEDGHHEWCGRCEAPADEHRTWTWCPGRTS